MCHSTHRISDPLQSEVHCAECGLVFEQGELLATPPPSEKRGDPRGVVGASGRSPDPGGPGGPWDRPCPSRGTVRASASTGTDGGTEFQHLKRVMQRQTARVADGPIDRSPARSEIALASDRIGLPPVVHAEAEEIYREAKVRGLFRGRSLPASVGAVVYAACRRYSIPRTLGEVAEAVGARRSEVGRTFKVVQRGCGVAVPGVGTKAFLARYAQELALSPKVRSNVEAMLDEARHDPELSGLSPHGLVAALIYLAAERNGERRSRAQVARVTTVTEVTLRSTSRILERIWGTSTSAPRSL